MQEEFTTHTKSNDRINIITLTLLMLLLTSSSFSVLGSLLGSFIPNQRITLVLVILSLLNKKFPLKKDYIIFLCVSVAMNFIIMLRIMVYPVDRMADTSDGGLIIFLATLPLYIELFDRKKTYLFKSLLIVIYLQIAVAIFQNIMMSSGMYDVALIFNNYHRFNNLEYMYPKIIEGFYRTSGLFIESSQYSIFLCFCYIYMSKVVRISEKEKNIAKYTKYIIFAAIFINCSITGYLTILFLLLVNPKRNMGMLILLIPIMTGIVYLSSSSTSELSVVGDYLSNKVTVNTTGANKGSKEMEAERSNSFFNYIEVVLTNRPVFGYGDVNEKNDRWDFVSTYLYGYGITGFIIMIMTVSTVLRKVPIEYYVSILAASTTNGNLQVPMYLLMFSVIFLFKKSELNRVCD